MNISERAEPSQEIARDLSEVELMTVLQALSDPVRLEIVRQLADCSVGELTCGQLAVPVAKSTASHHFKTLAHAGITGERHERTCKYIRLRRAELNERFPGLLESILLADAS
jgi:DNA-binding transcriptional ArsR family regulator